MTAPLKYFLTGPELRDRVEDLSFEAWEDWVEYAKQQTGSAHPWGEDQQPDEDNPAWVSLTDKLAREMTRRQHIILRDKYKRATGGDGEDSQAGDAAGSEGSLPPTPSGQAVPVTPTRQHQPTSGPQAGATSTSSGYKQPTVSGEQETVATVSQWQVKGHVPPEPPSLSERMCSSGG